ncbi:MAG: SDR family oxidoreductase [Gammaproteobacteria bacterium]|nr:SDR family oxidoreductase [Gammaproteobacteria bacterium]
MTKNPQKTVLITGCSSGIGFFVAKGLKKAGFNVIATARKQKDVERLKAENLTSFQLDLADSQSIKSAWDEILKASDYKIYALFNNGAFGLPGALEDISREALTFQFQTNVFGWHELTNLVIPIMRQHNEGRIIQNSSVLGFVAMPYRGAYNASKYAIEGLTDTLRLELANTNIKLSLIEPGPVRSDFRKNAFNAFKQWIDPSNSPHKHNYQALQSRLEKEGDAAPFTVGPEAVLTRVLHALNSSKPQVRYYVTFPTYLFGTLKRFLPYAWLDSIMLKASGGGKN